MNTWPTQSDVDSFYGNPRGQNGLASKKWESENLVYISTPWKLVTAWDASPVKRIRVHQKCADSLSRVFADLWNAAEQKQATIEAWGLHLFAGAYSFRAMRNSTRLSMHSWGCAIDFDSARNALGDHHPHFATLQPVLDAFAKEGWTWGGAWKKPDGMHWQAASV